MIGYRVKVTTHLQKQQDAWSPLRQEAHQLRKSSIAWFPKILPSLKMLVQLFLLLERMALGDFCLSLTGSLSKMFPASSFNKSGSTVLGYFLVCVTGSIATKASIADFSRITLTKENLLYLRTSPVWTIWSPGFRKPFHFSPRMTFQKFCDTTRTATIQTA